MRKLLADTSISNNPKILEELKKAGWKTTTAYRQEKGTRCYQFGVLYRFENSSVIEPPNHSICVTDKQVTHYATEKTAENKAFDMYPEFWTHIYKLGGHHGCFSVFYRRHPFCFCLDSFAIIVINIFINSNCKFFK